jgi:hypothetical protein
VDTCQNDHGFNSGIPIRNWGGEGGNVDGGEVGREVVVGCKTHSSLFFLLLVGGRRSSSSLPWDCRNQKKELTTIILVFFSSPSPFKGAFENRASPRLASPLLGWQDIEKEGRKEGESDEVCCRGRNAWKKPID